jgi:hypothetical protein
MASVEISLRALTVSRQRASGILLKKWCANAPGGSLDLHVIWCTLGIIVAHRRPECTHAAQIIDRNLMTQPLE